LDRADKGDVDAQTTVEARAGEADEGAEFGGGPLRGWSRAVDTLAIARTLLEGRELVRQR